MTQFFERIGLEGHEVDKAVATVVILAIALLLRALILRQTNKRLEDPETVFRTRKVVATA